MEEPKQKAIDKILSFSSEELENWIRSRLHGRDPHFSIYDGYETNLSDFLAIAFEHISDENFKNSFLEVLDILVSEVSKYPSEEIETEKEYIYELLTLCRRVKQYKNRRTLFKIAKKGKFKGFKLRDTDLHLVLLTTLISYKLGGNYKFWIEQMQDDSNKYYTNAAFYALLKHGYSLDILFNHIGMFIDRFKGEIELVFGIEALFDYLEPGQIYGMFEKVESQLSREQKEAVNAAFVEAGYDKPYPFYPRVDKRTVYRPAKPGVSMVGEKKIEYGAAQTLEEKAGEIFKQMGFEVEFNRRMAGHVVDIFIKKKKTFGPKYECYICKCCAGDRKANRKNIDDVRVVLQAVREEYDCDAVIIAEKGFTKEAVKSAQRLGIELKTLEELET